MATSECLRLFPKAAEIACKYPAATMLEVCEHIGITKSDMCNYMQQNKTNWEKMTGWGRYKRAKFRNSTGWKLKDNIEECYRLCGWLTRPLRSYKYTSIEYKTGVPA